ncbi:MAG: exodeoxyribonuclease VII small subunit [Bacteroidales bacterium]|nr:exodeoxyribonuclease VII small subunit [Bacteroidales bacterium]
MKKNTEFDEKILKSFDLSFEKLQQISQAMEDENVSVDDMAIYAKQCLPLIKACKNKLAETQVDIDLLVKELEDYK